MKFFKQLMSAKIDLGVNELKSKVFNYCLTSKFCIF